VREDAAAIAGFDEPFGNAAIELRDQCIVEPADVKQAA
jgi:hypothetical protein